MSPRREKSDHSKQFDGIMEVKDESAVAIEVNFQNPSGRYRRAKKKKTKFTESKTFFNITYPTILAI